MNCQRMLSKIFLSLFLVMQPVVGQVSSLLYRLNERMELAGLIVTGEVTEQAILGPTEGVGIDCVVYTVRITRTLKGSTGPNVDVIETSADALSSVRLNQGTMYLLILKSVEVDSQLIDQYSLSGRTFYYPVGVTPPHGGAEVSAVDLGEETGREVLEVVEDSLGIPHVNPALPSVSIYSVFAANSAHLEQNSEILSGSIAVNEVSSPPFLDSEVELSIGIGVRTRYSAFVKANRIKVKSGAVVNSRVYYNTLDNNGTINGPQHSPVLLPFAAFPEFRTSIPGSLDVIVPQNGSQALQPGNYRDITVKKNGVLTFTGGVYHLNSFNGGDNAQILFQGASEVRIAGKFDTDQGTYLGPQDTTTLSASQIVFYVAGINGSTGNLGATPKAAQIGIANTVKANFYVPNGTLWIRQNSQATGAFIGKDVDVGRGVKIWLKSAF